ncbi:hypothetical protein QUE93_01545 [Leuconostoc falkenbergense]|uniref:DUF3953 domain-containing protein n=1 Tax=Leuconostoc falkenbergense TaxID=2766470 RepID=A0ABT7RWN4_9LACO|nr:hypothetical protein [Leuconostoc falkenbergense]MDM7645711.1 hypothetical protein [Leuconostoc falkenbergense]
MKQKTWAILITVVSFILIALITATIITNNHIYTRIGSSFFGILTLLSAIPEIKKDGKLTWSSSLFLLLGLYFVVNPWI